MILNRQYARSVSRSGNGCSVLMVPGVVYYLTLANGWLKIGWTINLRSRLDAHRRRFGSFELIGVVPTLSCDEHLAHARFSKYRIKSKKGSKRLELYALPKEELDRLRAELQDATPKETRPLPIVA